MLSMINTLQIILHLPIFEIHWPAPIMNFYRIIIPFVMFDVIETISPVNDKFQSTFHPYNENDDIVLIADQT